jgi:type II secretory pathway component PulL
MKKAGAPFALLTPDADGWLLHGAIGTPAQKFTTLADAVAALPAGHPVHLALPCQALVIEGLKLPATKREELAGMVRLQLEKNLPYPPDEVSSDFIIVESSAKESSIIAVTAPHASLEALCQPLRAAGRLPEKITPYVLHVAATCPVDETVLAVYSEQGQLVLAICTGGRLRWAHVIAGTDAARLAAELPQVILTATMEGAPTAFARILLAPGCRALAPVFTGTFTQPIEPLPTTAPALDSSLNLLPAAWRSDARRQADTRQLQRRLQTAALLYLLLALGFGGYLFWLRQLAGRLDAQYLAARPKLELIQARQNRSAALAPAIDPSRTTVELLYLLQRALPGEEIRITEFDHQPGQWRITGEAPSAGLAIDYVARLKADPDLSAYQITAAPPQLLPNEHAQFGIFGKR